MRMDRNRQKEMEFSDVGPARSSLSMRSAQIDSDYYGAAGSILARSWILIWLRAEVALTARLLSVIVGPKNKRGGERAIGRGHDHPRKQLPQISLMRPIGPGRV